MGKEHGMFTPETVCMGTVTPNEKGTIELPSQKLFLELVHDGIGRGEIPGSLFLEPNYSASLYFAIKVQSKNPKDAQIIKLQKERYQAAMREWERKGMHEITTEEFRRRYLLGRVLIASSQSSTHRLHSVNLLQLRENRTSTRK